MPSLNLDTEARLQLVAAITEASETISIITLPSGQQLRLFNHCGHVAIEMIADDLLDESVDVSLQVLQDLQKNRDWQ
ncbi:hypothetical protein [Pseudomonas putida]|uniref:hypothetical protein n=1 Tax=Pseudomonas putida TaxID=303 RepID=UPI003D9753E0